MDRSQYMGLTFQHLLYFIRIAELGNMSLAAEEFYVTQPLLSQKIAQIEKALKVPLFIRSKQRLSLTEAGKEFLKDSIEIIDAMDEKVVQLRANYSTRKPPISIGFSSGQNHSSIRKVVDEIRASNKDMEFSIQIQSLLKTQTKLLNNELDITIFVDNNNLRDHQDIEFEEVYTVPWCCLMHKTLLEKIGGELSWKNLGQYPCVLERNSGNVAMILELSELAKQNDSSLNIRYVDVPLITLRNYLVVNPCFTLSYLQRNEEDFMLYKLDKIAVPFIVAWHKRTPPHALQCLENIIDITKSIISDDLAAIDMALPTLQG